MQVITPHDMDIKAQLAVMPKRFGGLNVSLIRESIFSTMDETVPSSSKVDSPRTMTGLKCMFVQMTSQGDPSATSHRTMGPLALFASRSLGFTVGCAIRPLVPGTSAKQRFESKTGVAIVLRDTDDSKRYVTLPTHLLTDAVMASKKEGLDSSEWHREVKVSCVASSHTEVSPPGAPPRVPTNTVRSLKTNVCW